jgi:non-ribosomal peptide synthase protein (TIGR01720 family)
MAARLQALPQAEVCFNYLGQFDQVVATSSLFGRILGGIGMPHSPHAQRSYLLEINGLIVEGNLRLDWVFSRDVYAHATVERLAKHFLDALRTLIAHCQSTEAGNYTPSDFPEAQLSSQELDELLVALEELEEFEEYN